MNKFFKLFILATLLFLFFTNTASSTVLTFEDTGYTGTYYDKMPAGYGGFAWSDFFDVIYAGVSPGYNAATVSGVYAAFNLYGSSVSNIIEDGAFDFIGAWFTEPENPEDQPIQTSLHIYGKRNGANLYSATIDLEYANPIWFQADWAGIDQLYFEGNSNPGDWFAMDDFTFNKSAPVPEPATMFLIGSGLLGLAGLRKKIKK